MSAPTDHTQELVGGRYRLTRLLGTGGMGDVWEAWDERLHRSVAVKRLHPQPGVSKELAEVANGRAMREARITARLQHPHAVSVFDVVEDQGQPCLVMQLVPSTPLSARLDGGAVLPVAQVALLGWHIASALAAAHQVGIVHRDVKPGNILLADDGTARISDFGIAHAMGDVTLTSTGMVTGTPAYLAPEVARGEESGYPADVFSLGATLYTTLEGRPPFGTGRGNPMALLHRVASGVVDPPQRSGVMTPLLMQMLQPRPEDRPRMQAVAGELADIAFRIEETQPTAPLGMPPAPEPGPVPHAAEQDRAQEPAYGPDEEPAYELDEEPYEVDEDDEDEAPAEVAPSRRRRAAWALIAVVVVLVLLAAWLLGSHGNDAPSVSAPGSVSSTTAPAASATASPPPASPAASAAPTNATPSETTPPATPSATAPSSTASQPAPSASTTAIAGTPSAADLTASVTRYYGLLPGGTDQAWPLMTASYQASKAGGRQAYQRFWDQFSSVRATDVQASPPGTVQATITYTYKDGRVSRERTTFGLVSEGGVLKINSSAVTG